MNDKIIKEFANRIYERTQGHSTALFLNPEMIEKVIYLYMEFLNSTSSEPYRNVNPAEIKTPLSDKYIRYVYHKLYGTELDYKKRDSVWVAISFIAQTNDEKPEYYKIWNGTYKPASVVQPVLTPDTKSDIGLYLTIAGVVIGIAALIAGQKKR